MDIFNQDIIPQYLWIYVVVVQLGVALWLIGLKFGAILGNMWSKITEVTVIRQKQLSWYK